MSRRINIPWLDANSLRFPDIDQALDNPSGLLAVGGDLSPARLLEAYRHGIFPWYEDPQPILWWSPQPRAVLYPNQVYINRSLKKAMKRGDYVVKADTAFAEVLEACSALTPKRPGTWITEDMKAAYRRMHQLGWAHSIEVWRDNYLIGGLYGLAIGKIFFGESMFSREANASKIALVSLCSQLQQWQFALIDCQVGNDYLYSMGADDISRDDFRNLLRAHARTDLTQTGPWQLNATPLL